ncbi:MAG: carbohydrate ABC transporter permease, partial [Clostridiales bacterium]|nr:carbohydrate ABC transporter permease [Clostridiales bacterium]
ILTSSLLAFIFSWNNFMFSLTLSGAKTTTLPIAIYGFVGYAAVDWGGLMAAAVFITLPIIVLSLFMQKYIISGLTSGAVKG